MPCDFTRSICLQALQELNELRKVFDTGMQVVDANELIVLMCLIDRPRTKAYGGDATTTQMRGIREPRGTHTLCPRPCAA